MRLDVNEHFIRMFAMTLNPKQLQRLNFERTIVSNMYFECFRQESDFSISMRVIYQYSRTTI